MRPNWKDAPQWANWLAMDESGEWWWYANRPELLTTGNWYATGLSEKAATADYALTLEPRP